MFYYLNGTLALVDANLAVIDCGGVGYACHTTNYTLTKLQLGKPAKLFTYCGIKEDAFDIYGFSTREELDCFKRLLGVTGVGPKAALSILSEMTPEGVAMAAASGDSKKFTKASGVGPKLAQRIVLELKDRVKKMGFTGGTLELTGTDDAGIVSASQNAEQAVQALIVLGYTQSEAAQAVAKLDGSLSTEELIRGALKSMASRF